MFFYEGKLFVFFGVCLCGCVFVDLCVQKAWNVARIQRFPQLLTLVLLENTLGLLENTLTLLENTPALLENTLTLLENTPALRGE